MLDTPNKKRKVDAINEPDPDDISRRSCRKRLAQSESVSGKFRILRKIFLKRMFSFSSQNL